MILVTGVCGFIGFHLAKRLLKEGFDVVGLDNINSYYDVNLKLARLEELKKLVHKGSFKFEKTDLCDTKELKRIFDENTFDIVINLAAQAGVRYSIEHPEVYIESNINGFFNIIERCRHSKPRALLYASSGSVYGANTKMPFSTEDKVDSPLSLYGASKKANELMAYSYSSLFNLPTVGLRFFSAYGPWGRPDMALFIFTKAILEDRTIQLYNYGNMERDFTYVDDIVESIYRVMKKSFEPETFKDKQYYIFNIGNHRPEKLSKFVEYIEREIGKKAKKEYVEMQPGDVPSSFAEVKDLVEWIDYSPSTTIETGIKNFINWYRDYYNVSKSVR